MGPTELDFHTDHLSVTTYGSFRLTDAIRPGPGIPVRPREGYRLGVFRDRASQLRVPMLSAAVSAEHLFEVFLDLLEPLGEAVHAVLETSHGQDADLHKDYRRNHIDLPVICSHFCDFEDLLINDGCTGLAVVATDRPVEVQFDEHKLIHVYAPRLEPFRRILRKHGVRRRTHLPLLCEAEHLHHSTTDYAELFEILANRVGVADFDRVLSDEAEGL